MIRKKSAIYKGGRYIRVPFNDTEDHTLCDNVLCVFGQKSINGDYIVGSSSRECCLCREVRIKLSANWRSHKYTFAPHDHQKRDNV